MSVDFYLLITFNFFLMLFMILLDIFIIFFRLGRIIEKVTFSFSHHHLLNHLNSFQSRVVLKRWLRIYLFSFELRFYLFLYHSIDLLFCFMVESSFSVAHLQALSHFLFNRFRQDPLKSFFCFLGLCNKHFSFN